MLKYNVEYIYIFFFLFHCKTINGFFFLYELNLLGTRITLNKEPSRER